MVRNALVLAALAVTVQVHAQVDLAKGFQEPPSSAKPHTWWHWINGNISKQGITADLEAMKKIGLGGAQIFNVEVGIPEGKVPFMSEPWKEALGFAFQEAKRLGIEICVHNCAGWSSSGGPWVEPQFAMQDLTWSETPVHGPQNFHGALPQPATKLGYYRDVAVFAVKKPTDDTFRIPNIRGKAGFDRGDRLLPQQIEPKPDATTSSSDVRILAAADDGTVTWNVPDGDWVIIRMGHTPTGAVNAPSPVAGRGPEVDKLSRAAMDDFWQGMMATALKENGQVGVSGLNNALIDSYEVGSQNWTPQFREEFKKRRGYDPLPFLPVVTGRVIANMATSEKFLWDYRRTICDLFADNYFGYFKELCHKNGLKFSTEGYGNGSFDNLQVEELADVPMGEFWVGGAAMETIKLAASGAHTTGKSVVGAESFTADDNRGRWLVDPYSIKALGDKVLSQGVNRFIFHRYAHQPWIGIEPGMTMGPWGMNLERTITWWDQGAAWMKEIARSQYLLQQGRFVGDILVFAGDDGPNDLFFNSPPKGFDYDGCDATVFEKLAVQNGTLVLPSGMQYKVVVLPDSPWLTYKSLKKVAQLVEAGATVVGPKPSGSPSLADDSHSKEFSALADKVWGSTGNSKAGSHRFGKGQVSWGTPLDQVLKQNKVAPDFESPLNLNWIHRRTDTADIYFVANPSYRATHAALTFRVSGKTPEIWNPETGEMGVAPSWLDKSGKTVVPVTFEPAGSVFVVFRKPSKGSHPESFKVNVKESEMPRQPKIEVFEARYEATDGAGGTDVLQKVKQLLANGETEIAANNSNFGDPSVNHVKRLHIVYAIDGKRFERNIDENETLTLAEATSDTVLLDYELHSDGIWAWNPLTLTVKSSNGKSSTLKLPGATKKDVVGPWSLKFDPKKGGPGTPMSLPKLDSWTTLSDPGAKYYSGTATYTKSVTFSKTELSKGKVVLDLGRVKNFAEVSVNGHPFETLWKAPFRVDVTKALHEGDNDITIKVTNLWPNRLIGDEVESPEPSWTGGPIRSWPDWILNGTKMPESKRVAFATWKFFNKDSKLLDSGLMGPVSFRIVKPVKLGK